MTETRRAARRRRLILLVLAAVILVPSLFGFGTKFLDFIALYRGDVEGVFAVTPVLNYLLASLGFLCLFGWAVMSGMFRDIERPKYTMLENEALLDRQEARPPRRAAALGGRLSGAGQSTAGLNGHDRFKDHHEHD